MVGGGSAIMDFAGAMDGAAFPQQAFGQRGLAGIDVGNDAQLRQRLVGMICRVFKRCVFLKGIASKQGWGGEAPDRLLHSWRDTRAIRIRGGSS